MIEMSPEMTCTGCFSSAEACKHHLVEKQFTADVVLLDLQLPGESGLSLIPLLMQEQPNMKVLVITQDDSYLQTLEAVKLGSSGYILKTSSLDDIEHAVRDVAQGGSVIEPRLCSYVLEALRVAPQEGSALSPREHQILELMAMGKTKKEVAQHLNISYGTVAQGTERIYKKLRVPNVTAAVASAIRKGLL